MLNQRITLKSRPTGIPGPEHFSQDEAPIRPLEPGELLVETLFISIDPAMRSWISDTSGYARGVAIGDPMRAGAIARVLQTQAGGLCCRRSRAGSHRLAIASDPARARNAEARSDAGFA